MVSLFAHSRPVIGISGGNADSASVRAMMTQIASTGAIPLFLGNHGKRSAANDIEKIDALVVMGNNKDIDPAKYGQQKHAKTNSELDTPEGRARAEYEEQLITLALEKKMPYLGVCGGMQRLNVLCGGSLHQHVPDMVGNDDHAQQAHNIAPFVPVQLVHLQEDSLLAEIGNKNGEEHWGDRILKLFVPTHKNYDYAENSMHHQAVNEPGAGLRPSAYSQDGITEAIETDPNGPFKDQFVLGVQWHPEFSASELGAKIATRMNEEAQKFAKAHNRQHPPGEAQDETMLSALADLKKPEPDIKAAPGGWVDYIVQRAAAATQQQGR